MKFTFTAMHGVGYPFTDEATRQFGFSPVIPVPEQVLTIGAPKEQSAKCLSAKFHKMFDPN